MGNNKFYICRDCGYQFYEINEDKECPNCQSKNIDLHRIFKSDNAGENEKVEHLKLKNN
jgi:DNA-directed RNA polymerase subunit RPC12/RpoP